jgi:sugar transferase EpsL
MQNIPQRQPFGTITVMQSEKVIRTSSIKRVGDIILSFMLLLIIWPVMILISICVLLFIGRPILFSQIRPGFRGKPFKLLKFRSMNDRVNEHGILLPDNERLTGFGKFLRNYSLDELPELFNVLKGEMSLVGPRPLLMQYLDRYSPEQTRRHDVLPGITGWAQVNGRNNLTWQEKFQMDVWYVDNWSIVLDIKILLITIWKVLSREGISEPGFATSQEFMGNKDQ